MILYIYIYIYICSFFWQWFFQISDSFQTSTKILEKNMTEFLPSIFCKHQNWGKFCTSPQEEEVLEDDLSSWSHHPGTENVKDDILQMANKDDFPSIGDAPRFFGTEMN